MLESAHEMKVSVNLLISVVLRSRSLEVALGFVQQLCSSELRSQPVVNVNMDVSLVY